MTEDATWSRLQRWVDGVAGPSPLQQAKNRVQHTATLLNTIIGAPYAVMFVRAELYLSAAVCALMLFIGPIGLWLSRRGKPDTGGSLISLSLYGAILAALIVRGGVNSNAAIWLLLCPMLAFLMVGPRHGVFVGVLVGATCAGLWALQTAGVPFVDAMDPALAWVMVGVDHTLVPLIIAVLMSAQAGTWRRLITHLDEEVRVRKAAEQDALGAAEARYTFLATMSHEIRTPLNGVLGLTEALLDSPLEDDQRQLAETVRGSGRLLRSLLDDVLDFSRIDTGNLRIEDRAFDLRRLCEDIAQTWRSNAEERGLALALRWQADTPNWFRGDENRIRQILGNLTSNAIKFTADGAVTLSISAADEDIVLAVSDTGIGIPPEALGTIFQPFQQADASTSRRFGGTGLGLAISRQLAEAMGGSLSARSDPGAGATFTVRLPLRHAPPTEADAPRQGDAVLAGRRVLVAEDNAINQMVMRRFLERHGVEVLTAEDGEQAIAQWRKHRPDLILMDCQMPGCDGYEATRRLRSAGARLPIIAVTANNMPGDRQRCIDAGMDDFMGKPVQPEVLAETLQRWLRQPEEDGEDACEGPGWRNEEFDPTRG